MKLPKKGSIIRYSGKSMVVESLGNKIKLSSVNSKQKFSIPLKEFAEVYGSEDLKNIENTPKIDKMELNKNKIKNSSEAYDKYDKFDISKNPDVKDISKNNSLIKKIKKYHDETYDLEEEGIEVIEHLDGIYIIYKDGEIIGDMYNGLLDTDMSVKDFEKVLYENKINEMELNKDEVKDAIATYIADGMSEDEAIAKCAEEKGVSEEEIKAAISEDVDGGEDNPDVDEDGNFGIPPQGQSTAVIKLPSVREFLTERKIDREIRSLIIEGAKYRSAGIIKNIPLHESSMEDKPNPEEGSKTDDNTSAPKQNDSGKKQDDPKIKEADPIDINKGDDLEIVNVDPKNKEVIAKFGDKEIKLSTDYFVSDNDKEAVLERVNEEEETEFGNQIAAINKWFEGDGGYSDADSFEWDGKTLTITKADGSTETKSKEDLVDVLV